MSEDTLQQQTTERLEQGAIRKPLDQRSFDRLYAELKDEQAKGKNIKAELDELKQRLEATTRDNQILATTMKELVTIEREKINQNSQATETAARTQLKDRITELEKKRKEAKEEFDFDEYEKLTHELIPLQAELETAIVKSVERTPVPVPAQVPIPEEAKEFIQTFKWANPEDKAFDKRMLRAAKEYELELLQDPQWKDKSMRERLQKVAELVEEEYEDFLKPPVRQPETPDTRRKPVMGVEPAPRFQSRQKGNETHELDPIEVKMARAAGMSLEQWVKVRETGERYAGG